MTCSTKNHPLPRRRTLASGFSGVPVFILCALLAIFALPANAETDEECLKIEQALRSELSFDLTSSDTAGTAARRNYLVELFGRTSSACAIMLMHRVNYPKQDDLTLLELFHDRLEPEFQDELYEILAVKFRAAATDGEIVEGTPIDDLQPPVHRAEAADSATVASNEPDVLCLQIQENVKVELSRKFTRSDTKGLAERRRNLNNLLGTTSRACAITLADKFLDPDQDDLTLFKLFHHKLAQPVREELLEVLDRRISFAYLDDVETATDRNSTQSKESLAETGQGSALDQSQEADEECTGIQKSVEDLLNYPFKRSDTEALAERRSLLGKLFNDMSPACATAMLYRQLGDPKQDDLAFYELFWGELAPATQGELLEILWLRSEDAL